MIRLSTVAVTAVSAVKQVAQDNGMRYWRLEFLRHKHGEIDSQQLKSKRNELRAARVVEPDPNDRSATARHTHSMAAVDHRIRSVEDSTGKGLFGLFF